MVFRGRNNEVEELLIHPVLWPESYSEGGKRYGESNLIAVTKYDSPQIYLFLTVFYHRNKESSLIQIVITLPVIRVHHSVLVIYCICGSTVSASTESQVQVFGRSVIYSQDASRQVDTSARAPCLQNCNRDSHGHYTIATRSLNDLHTQKQKPPLSKYQYLQLSYDAQ